MKINPHAPAFPIPEDESSARVHGLPIRLELAARMAQAIISRCPQEIWVIVRQRGLAEEAIELADALIAAYNEGQP